MTDRGNIVGVDLFCGAGGLTYGLERAGIEVRLAIDVDKSCEYPIRRNTKASFLHRDVDRLNPSAITDAFDNAKVSLLAGCAPCQPFSTYSRSAKRHGPKRRGRGDAEDWKLVARFGELIRKTQPCLVTMENVPPLGRHDAFSELLGYLEGYHTDYRIVECCSIGLPQKRMRLVVVASKLGPIHLPEFDLERTTVRSAIGALPAISAGGHDPSDKLHRASRLSEINLARIRASKPGGTWRDWPAELRAACHARDTGETYPSVYGRMAWDGPAPTITTQCFGYGNGRFGHPEQDRAISLREAAMLQGFPRNYSFISDDEEPSFAKLGRLIGNAVPVTLGETIGRLLVEHVEAA
jgi:DNA (cytosine-5)-methyltransferase 1